jgi:predicted MFS family arabinose efflux permease
MPVVSWVRTRLTDLAGGPGRLRVVALLAAVLGLAGADSATISAVAGNLKAAFGIGNTELGLLVSLTSVAAAVATVPVGVLTDRVDRTRLLAASVVLWAVAMAVAGMATAYWQLLAARVLLGVVTATVGPTVASLVGDYFPAAERARMYGLVLGGDLVGTGVGFVLSGEVAALVSWRLAFWWLVLPAMPLAWAMWRQREPARGGQSGLAAPSGRAHQLARRRRTRPRAEAVLRENPEGRSLWWIVGYVLRVRTNLVIIVASSLGYFFFTGMRSFVVIFATSHYDVAQSVASSLILVIGLGALAGVFLGGRLADRLLRRGLLTARLVVPGICLLAVPLMLGPGFALPSIAMALPLLTLGGGLLAAANPPLDAARLDVVHAAVWGRAEAVRTAARMLCEAAAPTLFGVLSDTVFHGPDALELTFVSSLGVVLVAGAVTLLAGRTYPGDLAAVVESARGLSGKR